MSTSFLLLLLFVCLFSNMCICMLLNSMLLFFLSVYMLAKMKSNVKNKGIYRNDESDVRLRRGKRKLCVAKRERTGRVYTAWRRVV